MTKQHREQDAVHERIVTAIDAARKDGSPVAPVDPKLQAEMANRAIRRWLSFGRRNAKADRKRQIEDLTKGLIEAFEPDKSLVGPLKVDWNWLAGKIADAISPNEPSNRPDR
jgi:hypothetical protein